MDGLFEFFSFVFSPGMFLYTLVLILVMMYWVVVIVGALDIGVLESVFGFMDGVGDGAAEGAAEAAGQSAGGALQGALAFLSLGEIPATVVFSILVVLMWFEAFLFTRYLPESLQGILPPLFFFAVQFVVVLVLSFVLTGLATRPMRRCFRTETVRGHAHLEGKLCTITSTKVTPTFGRAELRTDGSFLILDVRCDDEEALAKGDEAVLLEYHEEGDCFDVQSF
ncbi:MAG: hypothetical protein KAI66_05335 [Lentisphaeria bacterium]|nr:hypothetical protein [Lentisphaeria bacterium]